MSKETAKKVGMSLDEINAKYNPRAKIKEGLKKLGDNAMADQDFMRFCGVSQQPFSSQRKFFEDYCFTIRENGHERILWGGTKEFVKQAKAMIEGEV